MLKVASILLAFGLLVGCNTTQGENTSAPYSIGAIPHSIPISGPFLGCQYPSGNVWETSVASAAPDTNSAAWIKAIVDASGNGGFDANAPTTDELINDATNATPLVTVYPRVSWHTPYTPEPYDASFYIEPLSDAHLLTLQHQTCEYYEAYDASPNTGGGLLEYNGGLWDLTQPFVRPPTGAISTASGIPIGLVAVRPEELTSGIIRHALGWDAVAHTLSQTACLSPAAVTNCTDSLSYRGPSSDTPMPYGAHGRLKASFDISAFPTEAKIVATALKTYGAYAYDTGCCNTIIFVNDSHGAPTWTSADSTALSTIKPSDFDIVPAP